MQILEEIIEGLFKTIIVVFLLCVLGLGIGLGLGVGFSIGVGF